MPDQSRIRFHFDLIHHSVMRAGHGCPLFYTTTEAGDNTGGKTGVGVTRRCNRSVFFLNLAWRCRARGVLAHLPYMVSTYGFPPMLLHPGAGQGERPGHMFGLIFWAVVRGRDTPSFGGKGHGHDMGEAAGGSRENSRLIYLHWISLFVVVPWGEG